jgi:hypothetical protein
MSAFLKHLRGVKAHKPAMGTEPNSTGNAQEGVDAIVYDKRQGDDIGLGLPRVIPAGMAGTRRFKGLQLGEFFVDVGNSSHPRFALMCRT